MEKQCERCLRIESPGNKISKYEFEEGYFDKAIKYLCDGCKIILGVKG